MHFTTSQLADPISAISQVLEKLGRRKEALELYERACVLAPESPIARFKRVKMLIAQKQYHVSVSFTHEHFPPSSPAR